MPRFMYSTLLLTFVSFSALLYLMLNKNPQEPKALMFFLIALTGLLSSIFSIVLFYLAKRTKHTKELVDLKHLYRRTLKKSIFVTLYIIGLMILRITDVFSILTTALFTVTYFLSPYLLSKVFK